MHKYFLTGTSPITEMEHFNTNLHAEKQIQEWEIKASDFINLQISVMVYMKIS